MTRTIALRAVGALALVAALAPLPAIASQIRMTASMFPSTHADRAWVTVYRSELSGMQRSIVASGWMRPHAGFSTTQYSGYHYFFRAQVHHGEAIVADTTVEVDPRHHQRIELVGATGHFYWQLPR